MTLLLREQEPLAQHTTLGLGGPARYFHECTTEAELREALTWARERRLRVQVMGGGSNLVVVDAGFPGLVLKLAIGGIALRETTQGVELTAAAGVEWDALVRQVVERGWTGLECLSGIPGSVGATPIQNVGAYGCEVAESLVSIDLYDRATGEIRTLDAEELGFAYRTSILKGTDSGVVLKVRFEIREDGLSAPVRYAELARKLGVEIGKGVPAAEAREAVLALRRGKGMV